MKIALSVFDKENFIIFSHLNDRLDCLFAKAKLKSELFILFGKF